MTRSGMSRVPAELRTGPGSTATHEQPVRLPSRLRIGLGEHVERPRHVQELDAGNGEDRDGSRDHAGAHVRPEHIWQDSSYPVN